MKTRELCVYGFAVCLTLLVWGSAASATPVDFSVFENTSSVPTQGLILGADVLDGGSFVDFVFFNDSTVSSFVSAIYVESTPFTRTALANGRIVTPQPTGVSFTPDATPRNPPANIATVGGTWGGTLFSADAKTPSKWGLAPEKTVTIRFDYRGADFNAVMTALANPVQFRLAEHVQGLSDGATSVWAVNGPKTPIPLPPTLWFFAFTIGGWMVYLYSPRRRRI